MKKIAITGHSDGIGLCLYNHYIRVGYHVEGFSRKNGYDITKEEDRKRIIDTSQDFDIFINNAYAFDRKENYQLLLFNNIYSVWKNRDKIIVNISSTAGNWPMADNSYNNNKFALDRASLYANSKRVPPSVINIKPSCTEVNRLKTFPGIPSKKLSTETVTSLIEYAINFKGGRITSISVHPDFD